MPDLMSRRNACALLVMGLSASAWAPARAQRPAVSVYRDLGIPAELWACHSASVAGYAIEGHVPAHALRRLLTERPSIGGLAVPGMPIGSPGMEGGEAEIYSVIAFAGDERKVFGRYRGSAPA